AGCVVMLGAALTWSLAGPLEALPSPLVKTALYRLPFCAAVVVKVSVGAVAPAMLVKLAPPSLLTCHCTVGAGVRVAAAVNVAVLPAAAVWFAGWIVTTGAVLTVKLAGLLAALPAVLVKTASYRLPFCAAVGLLMISVVEVAPAMLAKVRPPSVLTRHCTGGAGVPLAAAANLTELPALTVWFAGWVVKTGPLPAALTVSAAALLVALPRALVKTAL